MSSLSVSVSPEKSEALGLFPRARRFSGVACIGASSVRELSDHGVAELNLWGVRVFNGLARLAPAFQPLLAGLFLSSLPDKSGWGKSPHLVRLFYPRDSPSLTLPMRNTLVWQSGPLSLDGWSSVLHGDELSSIDVSLAPALEAVYVDHSGPPLILIFGSLPAPVGLWICPVYSGVGRWFLASGFITMGVVF